LLKLFLKSYYKMERILSLKNKTIPEIQEICKSTPEYFELCNDHADIISQNILLKYNYTTVDPVNATQFFNQLYSIDPELANNDENLDTAYKLQFFELAKMMIINKKDCNINVTLSEKPVVTKCEPVPGKYILVTGGAGYIGSHTVFELLEQGHNVIIIDDFSNSCDESIKRVENLAGREVVTYNFNVLDKESLLDVFKTYPIWAVIHFAGFKSVNESIEKPLMYYKNNTVATMVLLECMLEVGCLNIVFSSSATVYGENIQVLPIPETHSTGPINPYGFSKLFSEQIIKDICVANPKMNAAILRYFNPIGAHESGMIGEDPKGIPNNLLPYISQVLGGKRTHLNVFGADYNTSKGLSSGIRDFISVHDLATGHLSALEYLRKNNPGCDIFNLGTGSGYSVLQIVEAMEKVSCKKAVVKIVGRRPGDVGEVVGDASKANRLLGWIARRSIGSTCNDIWRWQTKNPDGFKKN
jgi:UDP-glucose 4-epimerase